MGGGGWLSRIRWGNNTCNRCNCINAGIAWLWLITTHATDAICLNRFTCYHKIFLSVEEEISQSHFVRNCDWHLKKIEHILRDKNDQTERQKENEKRRREERLTSASLSCCFRKLVYNKNRYCRRCVQSHCYILQVKDINNLKCLIFRFYPTLNESFGLNLIFLFSFLKEIMS